MCQAGGCAFESRRVSRKQIRDIKQLLMSLIYVFSQRFYVTFHVDV